MHLNQQAYPTIHKAALLLLNDNGVECDTLNISITTSETYNVFELEKCLKELSETDLEEFCTGEYDDQLEIASRNQGLLECHSFLEMLLQAIMEEADGKSECQ